MPKKTAVIIREKERQYEGLRSSLGLLRENHEVSLFILGHDVEMADGHADGLGFVDEMCGHRFSDVPVNVDLYGFKPVTIEELGRKLPEFDLIIPF